MNPDPIRIRIRNPGQGEGGAEAAGPEARHAHHQAQGGGGRPQVEQGIFWLSTERLSRSTLHLIEGGEGSM